MLVYILQTDIMKSPNLSQDLYCARVNDGKYLLIFVQYLSVKSALKLTLYNL